MDAPVFGAKGGRVSADVGAKKGVKRLIYEATSEIDRETEIALFHAWRERGSKSALTEIFRAHLPLVIMVARKGPSKDFDDAFAAGLFGMQEAATRFDLAYECRFVTYAWSRIRYRVAEFRKRKRMVNERECLILDRPVTHDEDVETLLSRIPSPDPSPEDVCASSEQRLIGSAQVMRVLSRMPTLQAKILQLKWFDGLSFREIAKKLGLGSHQLAAYHEGRAIRNFRSTYLELYGLS